MPEEKDNYIKFQDGTIVQWGRIQSPANSQGYNTITFPIKFVDTNYILQATPQYASSSFPVFAVSVQRISTTASYVYFRQSDNISMITGAYAHWLAIGKWK